MSTTVYIALFGWPLMAIVLFAVLPPRRAALLSLLISWLFLPVAGFDFPGIRYDRVCASSVGVMLGVLLFDLRRLLAQRPGWIDLPVILLCLCAIPTSVANNLGLYDGVRGALHRLLQFAVPYLIGRLYFHDPKGLRELAVGIFVGGLVYVPLCLLEIRMSPQLHTWVYGFHQHEWSQTMRFGGWRPVVFMQHGLEVGLWLAASSLSGIWLWKTGALKRVLGVPVGWLLPPLVLTAVLSKSVGALALLAVGMAALLLTQWGRTKALLFALLICPALYVAVRSTNLWAGEECVALAQMMGEDRAESVRYRFIAEDGLARHAMRQPLFGWGGFGRNRPSTFNEDEPDLATDGLWIITLGTYGLVGIAGLLGTFLLSPAFLLWRLKTAYWSHPWCSAAAILAVLMMMFMVDSLMNAMVNPFYVVAAGGLSRAVRAPLSRRAARPAAPAAVEGRLKVT